MSRRYIIYGAGGIGGGIGALLQRAGREVVLIARGAHLTAMRERGLTVRQPGGVQQVAVAAAAHPAEVEWREGDVVILTMKGQDCQSALDDLERAAGVEVPVICGQNGVANERTAARQFSHVYGMLVVMPASFLTPGEIGLHGAPASGLLDCGRFPHGVDDLITEVCADLTAANFSATPDPQIMRLKYGKLLTNLGNAAGAVCAVESDEDKEQMRGFMRRVRGEAVACFDAAGIAYAPLAEINERRAEVFKSEDIPGIPRGGSSTWQSLERGLGSVETDWLNGEITLLGLEQGVPTPANRALQLAAKQVLSRGAGAGALAMDELLALESALS